MTSFDNIFISSLIIFQIFTMDGWTDIMYKIRVSFNSYTYDFFFMFTVIVGAFFVINLVTAI
jgi:hypothetical protein